MSNPAQEKLEEFLNKNYPCKCPPADPDCDGNREEAGAIIELLEANGYVYVDEYAAAKAYLVKQHGLQAWEYSPNMRITALARVREFVNLLKGAKQ